ncbi:MAG: hypothetical protein HYT77_01540, partial [Deltaproteobacteria bacterium]|nr:hypothetical protein [Deltaproteobacteria bacterium]
EICGDALCNGSESPTNCPSDCGSVAGGGGYCGDGSCQAARGETTTTCSRDCTSQQQQQSVNLPSTFTLTRGTITASTCPAFSVGVSMESSASTVSSQTATSGSIELTISGGNATGTVTKASGGWGGTANRQVTSGPCTFTSSDVFVAGIISPFSCGTLSRMLTVVSGNCVGQLGSSVVGTTCTIALGNASCTAN